MHTGKLILIGAGPGAADLITVRGLKALRTADVILYDALATADLLYEAKPGAKILYVGKRAGHHSHSQAEINTRIIEFASTGKIVVRLKGGDPFVFGRGYEEVLATAEQGIPVEIIPGISSAFSVPALAGIPVTHRGVSQGVRIVTAVSDTAALSESIRSTDPSRETLVIFMGLAQLPSIIEEYQQIGQPDASVAVIQGGSTQNERIAIGTISSILEEVEANQLSSPALIIIGNVVRLHPAFQKSHAYA